MTPRRTWLSNQGTFDLARRAPHEAMFMARPSPSERPLHPAPGSMLRCESTMLGTASAFLLAWLSILAWHRLTAHLDTAG